METPSQQIEVSKDTLRRRLDRLWNKVRQANEAKEALRVIHDFRKVGAAESNPYRYFFEQLFQTYYEVLVLSAYHLMPANIDDDDISVRKVERFLACNQRTLPMLNNKSGRDFIRKYIPFEEPTGITPVEPKHLPKDYQAGYHTALTKALDEAANQLAEPIRKITKLRNKVIAHVSRHGHKVEHPPFDLAVRVLEFAQEYLHAIQHAFICAGGEAKYQKERTVQFRGSLFSTLADLFNAHPGIDELRELYPTLCEKWRDSIRDAISSDVDEAELDKLVSAIYKCVMCSDRWGDLAEHLAAVTFSGLAPFRGDDHFITPNQAAWDLTKVLFEAFEIHGQEEPNAQSDLGSKK